MASLISQMRNGMQPNQQPQPQISEEYINTIKQMMHSKNPQQMIANMAAQNPQMRQIMQLVANSGNPKQVFENMAKERGVDPQWLLNKLMG